MSDSFSITQVIQDYSPYAVYAVGSLIGIWATNKVVRAAAGPARVVAALARRAGPLTGLMVAVTGGPIASGLLSDHFGTSGLVSGIMASVVAGIYAGTHVLRGLFGSQSGANGEQIITKADIENVQRALLETGKASADMALRNLNNRLS
jgi:hypothetical protein